MTADEFVADVNRQLDELGRESAAAQWIRVTYITPDTAVIAAKSSERMLAFHSEMVEKSRQYQDTPMSEDTARAIKLLKLGTAMPAPRDPAKRAELAEIATRMEGQYGEGKYCPAGPDSCKTLPELEEILADKAHDYDAQLEAWTGWRTISPKMRGDYTRFVELANEGARELGFADLGELWRSGYDMTPAEFEQETERLWGQVKPLYDQLHCYVRDRLAEHYGADKVSRTAPIPAHLLGNMWAQQWAEIYDLVEPYPGIADLNLDPELESRETAIARKLAAAGRADADLEAARQSAVNTVRMAEDFYTSLGMPALPDSFWERSMLTKPRDREVVCHASAWTMDGKEDVRIKQCIRPTGEELFTVFHELGHVYYDLMYKDLPMLFQGGAHDGFHEAIGDTVNLSMTSEYLHKLGLISAAARTDEAIINEQMKLALDKIAFLPFGKMIDMWRWAVFDGRIPKDKYNEAWWELRTRYQGIAAPVTRTEADFDPGAKYHIPGNTPYTRYFLSFVMQFQFHKALCAAAGYTGPLHQCSVYGNKQAGERFMAMLRLGASRPWQEALEQLTGSRQMDAGAITEYFQPLMDWLKTRNADRTCGW
jgi:peptidyl-dipeptidase A